MTPGSDRPPASPRVLVRRCSYDNLGPAVAEAFDRFPLKCAGHTVLVKPNMLGPYPPERGVTTHPALVRAVVRELERKGARALVGDNPGARGYGITARCGLTTGIAAAAGGRFVNLGEGSVEVALGSPLSPTARVARQVMEADLVVSLPKLKTHVQTVITGGLKNTYGYLVGAEKSRLHALARSRDLFAGMLVDVYAVRPPDLTIVDAVEVMEGDGPSSGTVRRAGLLLASDDALAADLAGCRLFGLRPADVAYLAEALRRFPRAADWVAEGDPLEPLPDFRLPATVGRDLRSWLANAFVFTFLRKSRLRVDRGLCTGCGACAEGCPVDVITLRDGIPVIDTRRCIACYCCHELCPTKAMQINPLVRAMLERGL